MSRPRSENPRNKTVLIRLTAEQKDVLDAMSSIDRTTPNRVVLQILERAFEQAKKDELVIEQMTLHSRNAGRDEGSIRRLDRPKKKSS